MMNMGKLKKAELVQFINDLMRTINDKHNQTYSQYIASVDPVDQSSNNAKITVLNELISEIDEKFGFDNKDRLK